MYTENPNVLPFTRETQGRGADVDVLHVLAAALRESRPIIDNKVASPALSESHQEVQGEWNLQVSEGYAMTQTINGNHNVQISGGNIVLRVNMHVKR